MNKDKISKNVETKKKSDEPRKVSSYFIPIQNDFWSSFYPFSKCTIILGALFIVLLFLLMFHSIYPTNDRQMAGAASKAISLNWEVWIRGTIVDVDPYSGGMLYELQKDNGKYGWVQFPNTKSKEARPCRGAYGAFYKAKIINGVAIKWIAEKQPTNDIKVVTKPIPPKFPLVPKSSWRSIEVELLPIEKNVLVKYKDDVTITTAYINRQKEWKLETDREKIGGGKEIVTIKEWKEIPK